MSNLFKAGELPDLIPFDFDVIDAGEGKVHLYAPIERDAAAEKAPKEAEAPPEEEIDPYADLERMIQERLLEVERRAQYVEKEAYEKGYAQGEKDGFEYGRRSMEVVTENLNRVLGGIEGVAPQAFRDYREWFVEACLAVSRHVVRRELETSLEPLKGTIRALLDEAEQGHGVTLYLNPRDYDLLGKTASVAKWLNEQESNVSLRPDSSLDRGGCRLETEVQILDASIETRFALLEKTLRAYEPEGDVDA